MRPHEHNLGYAVTAPASQKGSSCRSLCCAGPPAWALPSPQAASAPGTPSPMPPALGSCGIQVPQRGTNPRVLSPPCSGGATLTGTGNRPCRDRRPGRSYCCRRGERGEQVTHPAGPPSPGSNQGQAQHSTHPASIPIPEEGGHPGAQHELPGLEHQGWGGGCALAGVYPSTKQGCRGSWRELPGWHQQALLSGSGV